MTSQKSQKSKVFFKDIILDREMCRSTERYSKLGMKVDGVQRNWSEGG
jgi:hypothetical protein